MNWHFANVLEVVADQVPDRLALINGGVRTTWREFEDRAARVASAIRCRETGSDLRVGLYMRNCNEYIESHFAAFKLGACPVNINYRYRATELRYLLDNADVSVLVYHDDYADQVAQVRHHLPRLTTLVQVPTNSQSAELLPGAIRYSDCVEQHAPLDRWGHDPGDLYMLYTGGTTGMPKGVMYENGPLCAMTVATGYRFFEFPVPGSPTELSASLHAIAQTGAYPISLVACPLMHGTGIWAGALFPHLAGGCVVTTSELGLDPARIWRLVAEHGVTCLTIVGDAFARPLLDELRRTEERGGPYDISSLRMIISSGVMWSREVKEGLLKFGDFKLIDAMGSSEGTMGASVMTRQSSCSTGHFSPNDGVRIIAEDGGFIEPDSDAIGLLATPSLMKGYYKDPEKTQKTIREIAGTRYVVAGDYAAYEKDGAIRLLGRGSMCINSGGEKIFPEEVEEAIKRQAAIDDCLVVGIPDERFGEKVVAVVAGRDDLDADQVVDLAREHIAGYKLPKEVVFVEAIVRGPNGKADYPWAKEYAANALRES